MKRTVLLLWTLGIVVPTQGLIAQQEVQVVDSATVARILAVQKALEERAKTFKFGLSIGYRRLMGKRDKFFRDAVLNPADSTVVAEKIDLGSMVLSGVVVAYPWKPPVAGSCCGRGGQLWRLGFIANLDLASFANDEVSTFNRSIEGGGGLAWRFSDDFSIALTFERVFSRRLRSFALNGKKLPVGPGSTPGSFARDNETYFTSDNLSALSFKFVYFLR